MAVQNSEQRRYITVLLSTVHLVLGVKWMLGLVERPWRTNMMGITLSDGLVAAGGDFSAMTTNARDCGRAREMVGRDE